jgi:hypothetical protein
VKSNTKRENRKWRRNNSKEKIYNTVKSNGSPEKAIVQGVKMETSTFSYI